MSSESLDKILLNRLLCFGAVYFAVQNDSIFQVCG